MGAARAPRRSDTAWARVELSTKATTVRQERRRSSTLPGVSSLTLACQGPSELQVWQDLDKHLVDSLQPGVRSHGCQA